MRFRFLFAFVLPLFFSACQLMPARVVSAAAASPDTLWRITHDMCVPNVARSGSPSPCAEVNADGGFVVLKDIRGKSQHLLIPTARVSGIESPALLKPDGPNYFFDAWARRNYVIATLHAPLSDDALSLAINPQTDRSQNQLHIHMDCIDPDVRRSLLDNDARITDTWSEWEWQSHRYHIRRLHTDDLAHTDLFRLIAAQIPGAAANMAIQTIFVTGAAPSRAVRDGVYDAYAKDLYVITWSVADVHRDGHGAELLQDHGCAVATPALPNR